LDKGTGVVMTASSEDSVELEAKMVTKPRLSRHRARRRKRIAARSLLVLALVIGVSAISDFAYNAYKKTDCYTDGEPDEWGITMPVAANTEECRAEIDRREQFLRLDAAAAVLAAACVTTSTVISRRIKKQRR
jgi:hypothetical protein